jgi:phosphonate transport system permease protein
MAVMAANPEDILRRQLVLYEISIATKRRAYLIGAAILFSCVLVAAWMSEVDPATFFANAHKFPNYITKIFTLDSGELQGWFVLFDVQTWFWGFRKWIILLLETMLMAYVATVMGAISGFFLSFYAAGNLGNSPAVKFMTRRFLEFSRTTPELVFALIFVLAFGLGPMAGILAITVHTLGALGKLYYEVHENIDMKPVEGLTATGASWTRTMRFAVLPQVLPNILSYTLLRFEINVRGAAIMGFVGAGGIGQDLIEAIRKFYYSDVSAILVLIIITVTLIDLVTERIRHLFISQVN